MNFLFQFLLKDRSAISVACVHNLVAGAKPLTKEPVLPANRYVLRTHTCGELTLKNVGEEVRLSGWMEFQRMRKFIILRDSYGSTQLLIPEDVCRQSLYIEIFDKYCVKH